MTKATVIMAAAMLLVPAAFAGVQTQSSDAEAIDAANLWAYMVSKADIQGLEGLLADQYIHIHATALVESKEKFIEALKTGARKYEPIRIEDAASRIFGNCAVVTGKFNLKAFSRGRIVEGANRFTLILIKGRNGLQVVSFQATSIPKQ